MNTSGIKLTELNIKLSTNSKGLEYGSNFIEVLETKENITIFNHVFESIEYIQASKYTTTTHENVGMYEDYMTLASKISEDMRSSLSTSGEINLSFLLYILSLTNLEDMTRANLINRIDISTDENVCVDNWLTSDRFENIRIIKKALILRNKYKKLIITRCEKHNELLNNRV